MTINLTLLFPPSANRYWRHARGRTYLAKEALDYRAAVLICCIEQRASRLMIADPICIKIEIAPPDKRKWDLDNRIKQLLDALAHAAVYQDDAQVEELIARKMSPTKGGACKVGIMW